MGFCDETFSRDPSICPPCVSIVESELGWHSPQQGVEEARVSTPSTPTRVTLTFSGSLHSRQLGAMVWAHTSGSVWVQNCQICPIPQDIASSRGQRPPGLGLPQIPHNFAWRILSVEKRNGIVINIHTLVDELVVMREMLSLLLLFSGVRTRCWTGASVRRVGLCKGGLYARAIICPYLYIFVPHSLPHIVNICYYGLFVGVRPEEANFPYSF